MGIGPRERPGAWEYLESEGHPVWGDRNIVVAVIDSGVDYTHEDLAGNMWVNTGEIPDNGQDDDNNGFIDDVYGADVVGSPLDHDGDPRMTTVMVPMWQASSQLRVIMALASLV